jgi:four helix bundle suffix protein
MAEIIENQDNTPNFIPKHGGYRNLISYQRAEIIYDGTIYFTNRFYRKFDRTIDQMVQAARSGKQNIAEGSMASATSKETEIKLINVAKALINIATYLLARQIKSLEKDFLENGGLRERMTKARIENRNKK